ncbi:hypothetical protein FB45DRAFT_1131083 [Roridomyces roridus]|uniref:Uncharacterized protein n=1 Tax=Roridomyces roridus TaxID=1738132 RepID=A0AAD7FAS8_9AGAR|nr:hypothetical protein FB45DRAFT_1131083 [Roridomyces roridus]
MPAGSHRLLSVDFLSQYGDSNFWIAPAASDCFFQRIGALTNTPWASFQNESSVAYIGFNGTGISLIGYVYNVNDILPQLFITLDNGTESSLDNLTSGYYPWYQSPVLQDGFHTVGFRAELDNASLSTLVFDHAVVNVTDEDAISGRDMQVFDDTDASITYSGEGWNAEAPTDIYRYESSVRWSNTTGSNFSIPFNGVGITVVVAVDEKQEGNYTVQYSIDESATHVIDVSWPPSDLAITGLSRTAGGILTLLADATLPGNHTLHVTLTNISGQLPFSLDYAVATGALDSDASWYHPNRYFFLVPVVWVLVNSISLFFFRRRIIRCFRRWRAGKSAGQDIQLAALGPKNPEHDPLISTARNLPAGLADAYYDKGDLQALYTPWTLWLSLALGIALILSGIVVRIISGRGIVGGAADILKIANRPLDEAQRDGWVATSMSSTGRTLFSLGFTTALTLINTFISGPRDTCLKWALAREGRLEFNSSSNFFTSTRSLLSSTGPIATGIYTLAAILTFASAGFITVPFHLDGTDIGGSSNRHLLFSNRYYVIFDYVPLVVTGLCVAVQALLTLASYREHPVPTWSSAPLEVAAAAFSLGIVSRTEGRCLSDVNQLSASPVPQKPSRKHPGLADIRPELTLLAPFGILLGTFMFALTFTSTLDPNHIISATGPSSLNAASIPFTHGAPALALLAVFQAPLSVYAHALKVAERVVVDEAAWNSAATEGGYHPASALRPSWRTILVLSGKIAIQYLYLNGISFIVGAFPMRGPLSDTDQFDTLWRIGAAVTFVSFYVYFAGALLTASAILYEWLGGVPQKSKTYQPAVFGHIQTLVNLVDDRSPVMYWGHKIGGEVCHAGEVVCFGSAYR